MKLNKLFFASLALTCLPCGFISTSCNKNKDDTTENEYTNYIKQRSFAIMGADSVTDVFGTGWILSDSTPLIKDDYKYWMATNMHVAHSFYKYLQSDFKLYYADDSMADKTHGINPKAYQKFETVDYVELKRLHDNPSYFLYDDYKRSDTFYAGIDLIVFEVDFANCKVPTIVSKLDQLNKFQNQHGYINKFATIGDDSPIHTKKKHLAGYPYSSKSKTTSFECHNTSEKELEYSPYDQVYASNQKGHAVGFPIYNQQGQKIKYDSSVTPEEYYFYDVSPQYISKVKRKTSYMAGGASGSMIIDDDCNTIGIYWGGWQAGSDYYPAYSLFNSTTKNFIQRYIQY